MVSVRKQGKLQNAFTVVPLLEHLILHLQFGTFSANPSVVSHARFA